MEKFEELYKKNLGVLIRDLTKRLPYNVLLRLPDGSIRRLVMRKRKSYDLYLTEAISLRAIPILYSMDPALFIKNIPYGRNIRNKPKTTIPLIRYANSLYRSKEFYHEIIEDGSYIVSQRKGSSEYHETGIEEITSSFAGMEICLKCHFDISNLSNLGIAEIISLTKDSRDIDTVYGNY